MLVIWRRRLLAALGWTAAFAAAAVYWATVVLWLAGTAWGEPRPNPARHEPLHGFNDSAAALVEHADFAADLGANAVKVPIGWTMDPADFAGDYAALREAGLLPILSLWGPEPPPPDEYAAQAVAWARAYPSPIQLWSEPNHHAYGGMLAREAAALVGQAARAIWAAVPGKRVIGPALTPGTGDRMDRAHRRYQTALYRRLPRHIGVGLHPFVYSQTPMATLTDFYRQAALHGRVWVTEAGFFGNTYRDRQGSVTYRGYRRLAKLGAKAVIFHRLAPSPDPSKWEQAASMSVTDDPPLAAALREAWR